MYAVIICMSIKTLEYVRWKAYQSCLYLVTGEAINKVNVLVMICCAMLFRHLLQCYWHIFVTKSQVNV